MQAAARCQGGLHLKLRGSAGASLNADRSINGQDRCLRTAQLPRSSLGRSFYEQSSLVRGAPVWQAPLRRARTSPIAGSGKGFGQPSSNRSGGTKEQEAIKQARNYQLEATQLLAQLLQAKDLQATARENVHALSEEFFMIASTYLDLAKKEGNAEVVNQLESTLKVALAEKEKTLRPEIRLLNRLLREKNSSGRNAIFQEDLSLLQSEDGYFAGLVKRMLGDVERQPENPRKGELLRKLKDIKQEMKELSRTKK
ncbi:hypothetical protein KFL_002480050 [Klebsormidium nitens]|uniref:Uncharacterized protein n=1 Tax=Klebsormidium nitens TaxID=105231 RepID=A0A1Y1IAC4_KLENI|nr:hypothetical protein KFL_002480050 [Klebsormidium nitens]|eukprot:GAQ85667.1 hypothetical protein KFL_002480050 [Klebsormidium nitens]